MDSTVAASVHAEIFLFVLCSEAKRTPKKQHTNPENQSNEGKL